MIYNRRTGQYIKEKKNITLIFLYNNFIGRIILKLFTLKIFNNMMACYMNSRFSRKKIEKFIKRNHIDMQEYEEEKYKNFSDFFIRKIKEEKRILPEDEDDFLAPADSRLTVYPIDEEINLSVKNSTYTIEELVRDKELADKYKGGYCLVYRLCVDDYHRYHFIDNGIIQRSKKIKGIFHTVQPISFKRYKVFSENSREYTVLETENFGTITQIEVGALTVGKICNRETASFEKGEEKGYFCFGGSTVILLVEKDKVVIDEDILEHSKQDIETRVLLFDAVGKKS